MTDREWANLNVAARRGGELHVIPSPPIRRGDIQIRGLKSSCISRPLRCGDLAGLQVFAKVPNAVDQPLRSNISKLLRGEQTYIQ